ncbi:MAG: META domain-containing protein [Paracoccaceae bacterium]
MRLSRTLPLGLAMVFSFALAETGRAGNCPLIGSSRVDGARQSAAAGGTDDGYYHTISGGDEAEEYKVASDVDPMLQMNGVWKVTAIAGVAIPADPTLLLEFTDYQIRVTGPCNTFETAANFTPFGLSFGSFGVGEAVCAAEAMTVEAALLEALAKVDRQEVDDEDNVTFFAGDTEVLSAQR